MKRIRAFAVETAGMYFWTQNVDVQREHIEIEKLMDRNAVTEVEAKQILGDNFLRLLESTGVLKPFLIILTDDGLVTTAKDSVLEYTEGGVK